MGRTLLTLARTAPHQLDAVTLLVPLLGLVVGSLHLHGLEGLGEVVALREVLGPLGDVGLQQSRLLLVLQHALGRLGETT